MSEKATERKLIFSNLLNGVPVAKVAQAFHRQSEQEVLEDFRFVALKIKSYAFQRCMPYIPLDTIEDARANKFHVLDILDKVNLDVLPMFSSIKGKPLEEVYG